MLRTPDSRRRRDRDHVRANLQLCDVTELRDCEQRHPWSWTTSRDCPRISAVIRANVRPLLRDVVYPRSESFWFLPARRMSVNSAWGRAGLVLRADEFANSIRARSEARSTINFYLSCMAAAHSGCEMIFKMKLIVRIFKFKSSRFNPNVLSTMCVIYFEHAKEVTTSKFSKIL